ncbi:MAG: hypothetical protein ACLQGP_05810 [Isosphaeraceae bacterium]
METDLFTVDDGALLWFTGLDLEKREALDAAIARLANRPEKDWPAEGAIRLGLPEPTFMLKLGPRLRAFVRPTSSGKPLVLDFVNQETLDWFRSLETAEREASPLEVGTPS